MYIPNDLNTLFYLLIKGLFVLGAVIYALFAGIITRQINLMTRNVHDKFDLVIVFIGWAHFLFSLGLLLLTLLIL